MLSKIVIIALIVVVAVLVIVCITGFILYAKSMSCTIQAMIRAEHRRCDGEDDGGNKV